MRASGLHLQYTPPPKKNKTYKKQQKTKKPQRLTQCLFSRGRPWMQGTQLISDLGRDILRCPVSRDSQKFHPGNGLPGLSQGLSPSVVLRCLSNWPEIMYCFLSMIRAERYNISERCAGPVWFDEGLPRSPKLCRHVMGESRSLVTLLDDIRSQQTVTGGTLAWKRKLPHTKSNIDC